VFHRNIDNNLLNTVQHLDETEMKYGFTGHSKLSQLTCGIILQALAKAAGQSHHPEDCKDLQNASNIHA
jgi:hypothetical protein